MSDQLQIEGKLITEASSTLTTFACKFADGRGLLIEAKTENGPAPSLTGIVIAASELPTASDAVCKVDWSWIYGSQVVAARIEKTDAKLQLDKAGPLTISLQMWQGKPFLAFQPYRGR